MNNKGKLMRVGAICLTVVLVGLPFLGACAKPAPSSVKPIELSYSQFFPATHCITDIVTDWAREIEKRTNDRVKIIMYPGGTLTPADQCYQGVVDGTSDIGLSCLAYTVGRFPVTSVMDTPGLNLGSCRQGSHVVWELYKKFRPEEFNDTKLLYLFMSCPGHFQTKELVRTTEDLKGLQIRCTGLNAPAVEALGAIPVAIPMPDCYISIQKGIADGTLCPYESLMGFKLGEVIDYTCEAYVYESSFFVAMNLDKWENLPPDIQEVFEEVSEEWVDVTGVRWDENDLEGKEYTQQLGNEIITLSPEEAARWQERMDPILANWVKEMEGKGIPAQEIVDKLYELRESYK